MALIPGYAEWSLSCFAFIFGGTTEIQKEISAAALGLLSRPVALPWSSTKSMFRVPNPMLGGKLESAGCGESVLGSGELWRLLGKRARQGALPGSRPPVTAPGPGPSARTPWTWAAAGVRRRAPRAPGAAPR